MSKKKTPTAKPVTTTTETAPAEAPKKELTAKEKKRIRDAKYRKAKKEAKKQATAKKPEAKKPDENEKILASLLLMGEKVIAALSIISRIAKRSEINNIDIFILKEAEKVLNEALDFLHVKEAK